MNSNVLKRVALLAATTMLMPTAAFAQATTSLCVSESTAIGFFNGVNTTEAQAQVALQHLKIIYGTTDAGGSRIRYEVFYNATNGLEDFAETFAQRLAEQEADVRDRFENFFEAMQGGGTWTSRITASSAAYLRFIEAMSDLSRTNAVASLTARLGSPPTIATYAEHRTRIDTLALQGSKMLFIAHSQGNLFVNPAYQYARTKVGAESVQVVHIAPASPTLSPPGAYTLADGDVVINALRLTGSVPANTDAIPGYLSRPAGVNDQRDILGHGLLEIYLNPALATRARIDQQVRAALSSLRAPPAAASQGFFTVTMTWDGAGDVDLHAFEPDNTHVYYNSKRGRSGFLDVDNTVSNGPEHYFATCNAAQLQTGTYRIGINNYSGALGRTATLQLSTYRDGPVLTRSLSVGAVRGSSGNDSPIAAMTVNVARRADGTLNVTAN